MRARPRLDAWACDLEIILDETLVAVEVLQKVMNAAGKKVGVGDYRPGCKKPGPFGTYGVEILEIADI